MSDNEQQRLYRKIRDDLLDSIDEEIENELEDVLDDRLVKRDGAPKLDRKLYFREWLR